MQNWGKIRKEIRNNKKEDNEHLRKRDDLDI